MGEARRRGSFEDRKKQSLKRSRQDKWDAEQDKRRADKQAAEAGDVGRPVRPHRSGGGHRPIMAMACMMSAVEIPDDT